MKIYAFLLLLLSNQVLAAHNDNFEDDFWKLKTDYHGKQYLTCQDKTYSEEPEIFTLESYLFVDEYIDESSTDHVETHDWMIEHLKLLDQKCI